MKKFHRDQIKRQARAVRKAGSFIKSLRSGWGSHQTTLRKENIRSIKNTNGEGYDPIRVKQLVMSCSDNKAAMVFRAYASCTAQACTRQSVKWHDRWVSSCFDYRCIVLILLGQSKGLNLSSCRISDVNTFERFCKTNNIPFTPVI